VKVNTSNRDVRSPVIGIKPLGFPWETIDPFLFCVHHHDVYPRGNEKMGPDATLAGRDIGQDFSRKDGWSMYHGRDVPGFPGHPHRGFETVTIVRQGLVDHADSLGASARFGEGDVQWLTAGQGIVHSEMFPLLCTDKPNTLELFQIWLNLPARSKMAPAHFTMFWAESIPRSLTADVAGRQTEVVVVAGRLQGDVSHSAALRPLDPPPHSWAAREDSEVAIWTIRMAPNARWILPAAANQGARRQLYFFKGLSVDVSGQAVTAPSAIELRAEASSELVNGDAEAEFLLLQGKPIGEPVVQYGPFVMNSQAEISRTLEDYQRTQFGGWPWPQDGPVHGGDPARRANHGKGQEERPAPETGAVNLPPQLPLLTN
jgi:quercetin 2,3-dioxygenase